MVIERPAAGGARPDVVILLDSITRLPVPTTWWCTLGKILSAVSTPTRYRNPSAFRCRPQHRGRRIAHDHCHRADRDRLAHGRGDLREFKGTGNMELVPTAAWPTAACTRHGLNKSGTRKEECCSTRTSSIGLLAAQLPRRLPTVEAMEFLLERMKRTRQQEFFAHMAQ